MTRSTVISSINNQIPTNANNEISAIDLRGVFISYIVNSFFNLDDDPEVPVYSSLKTYVTNKIVLNQGVFWKAKIIVPISQPPPSLPTITNAYWDLVGGVLTNTPTLQEVLENENIADNIDIKLNDIVGESESILSGSGLVLKNLADDLEAFCDAGGYSFSNLATGHSMGVDLTSITFYNSSFPKSLIFDGIPATAIRNIQLPDKSGIIALLSDISGGGISPTISRTFAQLQSDIAGSLLVIGQSYLITDYETRHRIDGTALLNDNNVIEPLICTAGGVNSILKQVYSPSNPSDIIFWDNTNILCEDGLTSRKGKITRRIDTIKNIDTNWDFRIVQVERSSIKYLSIPNDAYNIVVGISTVVNFTYNDLKFGIDCHSFLFGYNCHSNTFGNNCFRNTFGNGCYQNVFSVLSGSCSGNKFGDSCSENVFGQNCFSNTFIDSCIGNTFGFSCYYNVFGVGCILNVFGDNCYGNTFANNCYSNVFGIDCYSNKTGNDFLGNTFGNYCQSNVFGSYCQSNLLVSGCVRNTFGDTCYLNSLNSNCSLNTFEAQCYSNIFLTSFAQIVGCSFFAINNRVVTTTYSYAGFNSRSPDGSIWYHNVTNGAATSRIKLI